MNAAEKIPQAEPARASIEAHETAVARWRAKVTALGQQMNEAQAKLDSLEVEAARAALEGSAMPDMGQLEAELRALKRARQMAMEAAATAEENLADARRQQAAEAAAVMAAEMVREAAGMDDTLAELGHRLAVLVRLGRQHEQLAVAGGRRHRRGSDAVSASAVAGAIFHAAPELFEVLQTPRPSHDQRQPLAVALARRHGVGPQLVEVTA